MTHDEALHILTACLVVGGSIEASASAARDAAVAHVASCRSCWQELLEMQTVLGGSPSAATQQMDALFGCDEHRSHLYQLVDLTADELAERFPAQARHLSWCHDCREALTDLIDLQGMAEADDLATAAAAVGKESPLHHVRRVVIAVRDGLARFAALPETLVAVPLPAPAGAWRADPRDGSRLSAGEQVTIDLGSSGLKIVMAVEPQESARMRLSLSLIGEAGGVDVTLRDLEAAGGPILAAQSRLTDRPLVVTGLRTGRYLLEVEDTRDRASFRIELQVERPA